MHTVVKAALAGVATGGRSFTPLAMLTLDTAGDAVRQPDRTLRRPAVQAVIALGAAGEYVGDKLPNTPSRLDPGPLIGRAVMGAVCGVILSRRSASASKLRLVTCAGAGAAGAVLGSFAGHEFRRRAAAVLGRDLPGAFAEDVLVLTVGALATLTPQRG